MQETKCPKCKTKLVVITSKKVRAGKIKEIIDVEYYVPEKGVTASRPLCRNCDREEFLKLMYLKLS